MTQESQTGGKTCWGEVWASGHMLMTMSCCQLCVSKSHTCHPQCRGPHQLLGLTGGHDKLIGKNAGLQRTRYCGDTQMSCSNLCEVTVILFLQQEAKYSKLQDLFFILLLCPSYPNIHRIQIQCVCTNAHLRLHEYTLLQTMQWPRNVLLGGWLHCGFTLKPVSGLDLCSQCPMFHSLLICPCLSFFLQHMGFRLVIAAKQCVLL